MNLGGRFRRLGTPKGCCNVLVLVGHVKRDLYATAKSQ